MLTFETKVSDFGTSLQKVESALIALSKKSLLVGIVADDDEDRKPEDKKTSHMTNSALGFIFEFGAPELKIPARPTLFPTLEAEKQEIQDSLMLAASFAIQGQPESMEKTLHALGMLLVFRIKKRLLNFVPPPLSKNTLRKWITPTKQRKDYGDTPLKVTAQFLNAFTYAVEDR